MTQKTKIYRIIISWDSYAALGVTLLYYCLIRSPASAEIIKEITGLAVSTLSIIFSVFFAALAVLITSGENEFVKYLQNFNAYSEIIWGYKYTLLIIFIALFFSIILYVTSLFEISKLVPGVYPYVITVPYIFLTSYAFFCTIASALDAIKYAEFRTRYIVALKQDSDKKYSKGKLDK